MSINSLKARKYLLTAGLLLVLAHGLWQIPDLQDYLFPDHQLTSKLRSAGIEGYKIENDLISLRSRMDYLNWFLAQHGAVPKVSVDRWLAFPFSESIRPLAPRYVWHINMYLVKKNRVKVQRKIKYLGAFLKDLDSKTRLHLSHQNTDKLSPPSGGLNYLQQIQKFQRQLVGYDAKLEELSKQLTCIENNDYKI